MPSPGTPQRDERGRPSTPTGRQPAVRILSLYPDLLDVYGDRGNLLALIRRAQWHGLDVIVHQASTGDVADARRYDLILLGGGQDRAQRLVAGDLHRAKGPSLVDAVSDNVALLAICAGYQLLGKFYRTAAGEELPGVGLFDAFTVAGARRMVGNTVVRAVVDGRPMLLVGFENHAGRTMLGKGARPLGDVLAGWGNNGSDRREGAIWRNAVGTYLHGSLLPKNPELADWLLQKALDHRYRGSVRLESLDDGLEHRAKDVMLRRLLGPPALRPLTWARRRAEVR